MAKTVSCPTAFVWDGPDYPRAEPGRYLVRGICFQGPEWVRKYRRWSLRIEFAGVDDGKTFSAFFNMGNDPAKTHIGRQSRYFKAWIKANGGLPLKGQEMKPDKFLEGQLFWATVDDSKLDDDGKAKADEEVYSRITEILSTERQSPESFNPESLNLGIF